MNLYLVFCVCRGQLSNDHMSIYVVADNPGEAEVKAMSLIRKLSYRFTDGVDKIELIASIETYRADHILVL